MRPALIAQVGATTALAALLSTFAALYVAQQTLDLRAGLVLRALLVTLSLLVVSWAWVRPQLLRASRSQLRVSALLGLVLGYALSPTSWNGRTYAAQLALTPGASTVVIDLVLWILVGGTAVLVASAPASAHERPTYAGR